MKTFENNKCVSGSALKYNCKCIFNFVRKSVCLVRHIFNLSSVMCVVNKNSTFSRCVSELWTYTIMMLLLSPTVLSSGLLPDEQVLLGKLFNEQQYDNSVRPVFNSSKNVEVNVGFTLIQIMDMVSISVCIFYDLKL